MAEPSAEEIFVRGLWAGIIPDTQDISWVDRVAAQEGDDRPLGDYGPLVRRMLEAGVAAHDIARFARIVGYEVAFGVCYHLADPVASYEQFNDDAREIAWELYEVDPDTDEPIGRIWGAHEILLGADPTGQEMRPPT
ncbi:MAG: hypothetical protein GY708_14845 [Actinomycetia bacterium]|nr:hypothetical protein [Actinomycetes bacterium]